ncbi:POTRA domain-containing protein [Fulvivirga lutea]|uniref:POTRA domain-containing protein n=1 Tax=Fulvivirga lutea TaxID=2810512 RepID=A0A974WFR5_9BACT|nr:POTRA domain-containing protein [Fulvivirga lutea]QSE96949.1 hypothetical protein JR347_15310 [Fulvivirga lutea]
MSALLLSLFLGILNPLQDSVQNSQDTTIQEKDIPLYIDAVFIIGNKKTKEEIIFRELNVEKGQTIYKSDLEAVLELDKSKLLNTRLFNTVNLSILYLDDFTVDIVVTVTERWYTFPVPIFDLVDRNFNDWWQNQDRDLSRTNYGVNIYKNNFRGRNETLRLLLQLGYTQKFGLTYKVPYLDKNKRHGMFLNYDYAENKNIAVRTENHKQLFLDSDETLRITKEYTAGYMYRRSFYSVHNLNFTYYENEVTDTVSIINPEYYAQDATTQKYAELSYFFTYDKRDFASYPLKGTKMELQVIKEGLGFFDDVNRFTIQAGYFKYVDLGNNFYFSNYTSAFASFLDNQPYNIYEGLGRRRDFVRGYELYLIEGKSFGLNRSTFKKRIFSKVFNLRPLPIEQFRKMPLDIYIKTYYDMGYVENFENYELNTTLSDRYLFGTGFGIDFVSYYDSVIRLEYSFNREQESGFFLHFKKEF